MINIIGVGSLGSAVYRGLSKEILDKCEYTLLDRLKPKYFEQLWLKSESIPLTILIASLGGRTGNKLALHAGNSLKLLDLPFVALTTAPFTFEEGIYRNKALAIGVAEQLKQQANHVEVFNNDCVLEMVSNPQTTLISELFKIIDAYVISLVETIIKRYGYKDTLSENDIADIGKLMAHAQSKWQQDVGIRTEERKGKYHNMQ